MWHNGFQPGQGTILLETTQVDKCGAVLTVTVTGSLLVCSGEGTGVMNILDWAGQPHKRMTRSTCLLYRELSREKDASLRSRGATWTGNPSAPFWLQCPHFSNIRDELWSSNDMGSNPESSVFWASCVMLGKLLIQASLSLSVKWE